MLRRLVLPEILDQLPENDPAAVKNRRDMLLLNRLMGNFRWIGNEVGRAQRKPGPWLELAAGDGSLGRYLADRYPDWADRVAFTGADFWARPGIWPANWNWEQGDLLQSSRISEARVVVANHILHQFQEAELADLGARLQTSATHLIINETARRSLHLWQARAAFLLGLNKVSRHDALVSVRAGFRGEELPRLLGLEISEWRWRIHSTALGAYRCVAVRLSEEAS